MEVTNNAEKTFPSLTFSVIIPTYNRAHTLSRAVDSVLKQTYVDFELLIIDDGSIDNTEQCVAQYNDARIKYFKHEKNMGQNYALNKGIDLAKGEYISFVDSDDEWLPEMLEKVSDKFRTNGDYWCVYTLYGVKDNSGKLKQECVYHLEGSIYKEALGQGYITSPTTLSVKKKCFDVIGKFELGNIVCQDDVFCLKLAKVFKFGLVKQILAIIHNDAGNQLMSNCVQKANDYLKLYEKFQDDIIEYCGYETLAKHYTHAGILFLLARNRSMAQKVIFQSIRYGFSLKGFAVLILTMFPFMFINKVRELRHSLRLIVEDRQA